MYLADECGMTELCEYFGVSRKTGYKWVERYRREGPEGLLDRSRAPRSHPRAILDPVVEVLLEARRKHPTWGPRKILPWLARKRPDLDLPAPSTVGDLFRRYGLTRPRRRRRRVPPFTKPFEKCSAPNSVWCTDFKGQFRTGDGQMCYPLTITDAYSRLIIRCKGLEAPKGAAVRPVFESAFREFGLPKAIRSDNGTPFASRGPGGLSKLSIWWLKLGIGHERIEPGRPEQNGRHERMHRTLKRETATPPKGTLRAQQRHFNRFVREFNEERPHEALGQQTPSSYYQRSERRYPRKLPTFRYPDDAVTRKVHPTGRVRWPGRRFIYIGEALIGEHIEFVPIDDDLWEVRLGPLTIGLLDETRFELGLIRI